MFRGTIRSRSTASGFTLVELLVVIGIIALLISILMPALRAARESANALKCASNQRQIATASFLYVNDHRGYIPPMYYDYRPGPLGLYYWYDHLHKYFNRKDGQAGRWAENDENNFLHCPSDPVRLQYRTSIGINRLCGPEDYYVKTNQGLNYSTPPYKIFELRDIARTAWYSDIDHVDAQIDFRKTTATQRNLSFRHKGFANVVFRDGHVERVGDPKFQVDTANKLNLPDWVDFFGF